MKETLYTEKHMMEGHKRVSVILPSTSASNQSINPVSEQNELLPLRSRQLFHEGGTFDHKPYLKTLPYGESLHVKPELRLARVHFSCQAITPCSLRPC